MKLFRGFGTEGDLLGAALQAYPEPSRIIFCRRAATVHKRPLLRGLRL